MTLKNDKRNKFERMYTKKFEGLAAEHGIGIEYDEDRAALDYGLHLTITDEKDNPLEGVTSTRVWFQFKGKSLKTLTLERFNKSVEISEQVEIDHLRQWYRYAEPVYLTIYIEAVDRFYAIDVKQFIDDHWGASIFKDETFKLTKGKKGRGRQKKVTIKIPKTACVDEQFWERLSGHRSMRIDGASYRGVPLPHPYDFRMMIPIRIDPALYTGIIDDLLAAHRYKVKTTQDAYQLYPWSESAGDVLTLTTGVIYDPYEIIPYMTIEMILNEEGFRVDGQTFKIQGPCAVLVHSNVISRPDVNMLMELARVLEEQGIKYLLVFVNHFMLDQPIADEKAYNCFPEYSNIGGGTEVFCLPQHLEDLGRNILLATNIYLKYMERIPWLGEKLRQKLESGELRIVIP
ncbi:MAG: hypothetical protein QOH25_1787 [Acidobacteriota bacterium]|jgi:hypothetical protein|nr:hypothetical protein [Acidobacteriota bacterium]